MKEKYTVSPFLKNIPSIRVVTKSIYWYIVGITYFNKLLQYGIFPTYIYNFISFNFDSFLIHILATYQ